MNREYEKLCWNKFLSGFNYPFCIQIIKLNKLMHGTCIHGVDNFSEDHNVTYMIARIRLETTESGMKKSSSLAESK